MRNTAMKPVRSLESKLNLPANVHIFANSQDVAGAVSNRIFSQIKRKPASVLGLATGETPRPIYAAMRAAYHRQDASFSHVTTFNLDEYAGLSNDHPDSFAAYMRRELFAHTDFQAERINLLKGDAENLHMEAGAYENAIKAAGGIDLQLLGIGLNGHIGFNEPGSTADSRTRTVRLSEATLTANLPSMTALSAVPSQAITMGIASILEAKEILIIAIGSRKARACLRALQGQQDLSCPASLLATHANVTWLLDEDASEFLDR